jgi:hypothetical protein
LLPPASQLRFSDEDVNSGKISFNEQRGWQRAEFKKHLRLEAARIQRTRMLLESRGFAFTQRHALRGQQPEQTHEPRGVAFSLYLGVPASVEEPAELVALADDPLCAGDAKHYGMSPWLLSDSMAHAKLRSRVVLRRTRLNADRNARSKKQNALLHCERCATAVMAQRETSLHVVSCCPSYANERDALCHSLSARLNVLLTLIRHHHVHKHIIADRETLLHHFVCASPVVFSRVTARHQSAILRLTGEFLETVHRARPL